MFYVNMKEYSKKNYIAIECEEGSNFSGLLQDLKKSSLIKSANKSLSQSDNGALFSKFKNSELKQELYSLFSWHV